MDYTLIRSEHDEDTINTLGISASSLKDGDVHFKQIADAGVEFSYNEEEDRYHIVASDYNGRETSFRRSIADARQVYEEQIEKYNKPRMKEASC